MSDETAGGKAHRQFIGGGYLSIALLRHDIIVRTGEQRRRDSSLPETGYSIRDRTGLSEKDLFRIDAFELEHQARDQMLETADPVHTDAFACEFVELLNARF